MKSFFVVSDVHSFYSILLKTLDNHGFQVNNPNHILVVCGDIFDRGEESVALYNLLSNIPDSRFIYIRGNHEDLICECVEDILNNKTISRHHFSNGTIKTIAHFTGLKEQDFVYARLADTTKELVQSKMMPIIDWINKKSVNYFAVGDYVLVHGWVPVVADGLDFMGNYKGMKLAPLSWWEDANNEFIWQEARWINGMDAWKQGCVIPGKTIICGHFHCSWGWSHLRQKRKEFPKKNHIDWEKSFEPFVDEGIIAIDACTAYSGIINCVVLEVEEENEVGGDNKATKST